MGTWARKPLAIEALKRLPLTAEEGFVLSRLDVRLTSAEAVAMTGLPPDRVEAILARLAMLGAVSCEARSEAPGPAPLEEEGEPPQEAPEIEEEPESTERLIVTSDGDASARRIFETRFRGASPSERLHAAHSAADGELMALCLAPEVAVLTAVLDSTRCGLPQARIAARWHPTAAGLEVLGQRAAFFSDPQLQRLLLRNPHLSELLAKRVLSSKRMLDAYKVSLDTDVPERTRLFARTILREKFGAAQGEEKAGVISATDGRVLPLLQGLALDGRATSILCARGYTSALFIQNLARFGSCPPGLLAHLVRQPIVRRQLQLKNLLLQHPNMPPEAKRLG